MRVTLAYPLSHDGTDHKADSSPDLPDEVATDLLASGRARPTAPKSPAARRTHTEKKGA